MIRLADIPIKVEGTFRIAASAVPAAAVGGLGGGVAAVLAELAALLERAGSGAAAASIDLRSLPMSADDRARLRLALGEGEVSATVRALGVSTVRETAAAGVWWVEHFDVGGASIAESLEVAVVPQILASAPDEMAAAAQQLRRNAAAGVGSRGGSAG